MTLKAVESHFTSNSEVILCADAITTGSFSSSLFSSSATTATTAAAAEQLLSTTAAAAADAEADPASKS